MRRLRHVGLIILAAAALMLMSTRPAGAWANENPVVPCDFVTGGGWIVTTAGAKANFGIGGGVKNGAWWGHLNYVDHGIDYHVDDTSITGYYYVDANTRDIFGTARSNRGESLTFQVRVTDNGEPGRNDLFAIKLSNGYQQGGDLGASHPGGGNIQLHKGNKSNTPPSGYTCMAQPGSGGSNPPPSGGTRIEQDNAAVVYTGVWFESDRPDHSGGTAQKSSIAGSRATLTFTGTGISWISFKGPMTGIANVYIDASLVASVDTYAATITSPVSVFSKTGLSAGVHTFTIEVTGQYNAASVSAWIVADAFDVTP